MKKDFEIRISINQDGMKTGMIEYVPGEYAWRQLKDEVVTL